MIDRVKLIAFMLVCCSTAIIHLPLDERFTTRVAFLNLAALTPFTIITQPETLLPSLKQSKDPANISKWFFESASTQEYALISLQMFLYGGLIASRISNFSQVQIMGRLDQLQQFKSQHPKCKLYGSGVVMRIPAYDIDFQEPSYWANYGRLLYLYSYFTDKYNKTGDPSDSDKSKAYKNQIPSDVLTDFEWRRQRNQNVLVALLHKMSETSIKGNPLFQKLYITLDDNAQYGFNIAQADYLKQLVVSLNLQQRILIYPGADQVPFALLSKLTVDHFNISPTVQVVYRNKSTTELIPNYEGQPLSITVDKQLQAAGATKSIDGKIVLLINNFDGPSQKEAPNQNGDIPTEYSQFTDIICSESNIIGFVDNKYSNGADLSFVEYILKTTASCNRNITDWTYAGWNTNGNTLGTAISNSVILSAVKNRQKALLKQVGTQKQCQYCTPCSSGDYVCGNVYFNLLRIVEDRDWQSILRQSMVAYIKEVPSDNFNRLDSDLSFYEHFALKSFRAKGQQIVQSFGLNLEIKQVYFPWNRTFQVGLSADFKSASNAIKIQME